MTIELRVRDIVGDACAKTITETIHNLDSPATVQADTTTKQVIIKTQASASSLKEAITSVGYNPD